MAFCNFHTRKKSRFLEGVHVCWLSRQSTVFRHLSHWPFHFDGLYAFFTAWHVERSDAWWIRAFPSNLGGRRRGRRRCRRFSLQLPAVHQGIVWPPWHGAAVPSLVACCRMLRTTGVLANKNWSPWTHFEGSWSCEGKISSIPPTICIHFAILICQACDDIRYDEHCLNF